jgi:hypothetical protein
MKYILLIITVIAVSNFALGQKKYSNEYELQFQKSENGRVCFIIYNYCRREKNCLEAAKIDAIKIVLFRGFNNQNKIYPIVRDYNTQMQKKEYFDEFFKRNGQYLSYIEFTEDYDMETVDITRRKTKSAMYVCVLRDNLLKEMQNQKIIKMLDNGF